MKKSLLNNQAGMSFAGILISVGLAALVTSLAVNVILETNKMEINAARTTSLQQAHNLNLQRSRSVAFVSEKLELSPQLKDCFSQRTPPGGCEEFARDTQVIETADLGCGSTNCLYQSVITLRPICNNQTCSRLQVSLETRKSGGDSEYKTLKSKGSLPAIVFADFKGISYACSLDRGELMTGLDFAGKQTLCQPPAEQATCLDQSPLSGSTIGPFTHGNGSCAEVSERDCASDAGIAQTSLLGSATRCVF